MTQIVLKDKLGADQVFTFSTVAPNGDSVFTRNVGPLLGRAELRLSLNGNAKVNRVKAKLSVPSVCVSAPVEGSCATSTVEYIMVGSTDISVVKQSSETAREDFNAMLESLAANATIAQVIIDGILPRS